MTKNAMIERRGFLRLMLGMGAAAVVGGALLTPTSAEAAPLAAPEPVPANPDIPLAEPVMAPDEEKPETLETQYYVVRRRVYPRRRVVVRRRVYPVRRRVVVRRRVYPVRRRVYVRRVRYF
jgi:hypothetical protein